MKGEIAPLNRFAIFTRGRTVPPSGTKYTRMIRSEKVRELPSRHLWESAHLGYEVRRKCPDVGYICYKVGKVRMRRWYVYSREDKAKLWGVLGRYGWKWEYNERGSHFQHRVYYGYYYRFFSGTKKDRKVRGQKNITC